MSIDGVPASNYINANYIDVMYFLNFFNWILRLRCY